MSVPRLKGNTRRLKGMIMLNASDVERLAEQTLRLLGDVGILVENEEVRGLCLRKGCTSGIDRRVRIPQEVVQELVAIQKPTQQEYEGNHELVYTCGPDWTHHLVGTRQTEAFRQAYQQRFLMQAFDCGPTTYYDYREGAVKPVDTAIFDRMMKLAEATPEIGYTSMWYRQDVPPMIERLDSLRRSMDLTKKFAGIEAIYPEVIKYLKETSVILTNDPDSSAYLAGSECINPPLVLERRSAEDILARKAAGVHRYHVASMPTLGVNTPVTVAGAAVMGAAEILGGMCICWCVDPGADISGRMIALIADMRNGNAPTFGPAYVQLDMAVRQLFQECWGGHCMVEVFFSPTARRPGLQAVFENFYSGNRRQRWDQDADIPYPGMGTLHNGGLGSPTQFMLDMEIRKAQWAFKHEIEVSAESIAFDETVRVAGEKGHFLTSEHTMRHFRELWTSDCFRSDDPFAGGPWDGTERAILDNCDETWRANLSNWTPPEWPDDKLSTTTLPDSTLFDRITR
jgi:trimethylamine:corrinoid methyltransferase-like protein